MLLDEIGARLVAQAVGTLGSNIFKGSNARLPKLGDPGGEGPFLTLIEYGGTDPMFVQNYTTVHVQRPSVQITARGTNYLLVRTMIKAAYNALVLSNTTLSGVRYQQIRPIQDPTDFGHDDDGRVKIGFNVRIMKQAS